MTLLALGLTELDEVKRPEEPPARSRGPEGPQTSSVLNGSPVENEQSFQIRPLGALHE